MAWSSKNRLLSNSEVVIIDSVNTRYRRGTEVKILYLDDYLSERAGENVYLVEIGLVENKSGILSKRVYFRESSLKSSITKCLPDE